MFFSESRNNCPPLETCCFPHHIKFSNGSSKQPALGNQIVIVNGTDYGKNKFESDAGIHIVTDNPTDLGQKNPARACGYRNLKYEKNLRTGPFNASASVFPWSVVIYYRNSVEKSDKLCVGSLVHRQVVLTLAHCVSG